HWRDGLKNQAERPSSRLNCKRCRTAIPAALFWYTCAIGDPKSATTATSTRSRPRTGSQPRPAAQARKMSMRVLETERLLLRRLGDEDAAFILELLNQPSFIRFIGDKGVRTLADAHDYLRR